MVWLHLSYWTPVSTCTFLLFLFPIPGWRQRVLSFWIYSLSAGYRQDSVHCRHVEEAVCGACCLQDVGKCLYLYLYTCLSIGVVIAHTLYWLHTNVWFDCTFSSRMILQTWQVRLLACMALETSQHLVPSLQQSIASKFHSIRVHLPVSASMIYHHHIEYWKKCLFFHFREMLNKGFYGDSVILSALSYQWDLKIIVLRADNLRETRFRHNSLIEQADLVLVFNGYQHYCSAGE